MFIISIILVALPLKRHRGFKFQAPITPQMFFVPDNIPNCLQRGNVFWKKCFLLLLKNQQKNVSFKKYSLFENNLVYFQVNFQINLGYYWLEKWCWKLESGNLALKRESEVCHGWEGGLNYWGYADGVRGGIELSKFLPIFTLTASFWMMKLSIINYETNVMMLSNKR